MKRLKAFLLIMILLCSSNIYAQDIWNEPQQTTFGIRAGFDLKNIVGTDAAGDNYKGSLAPVFHIGFVADIPFATDFYMQPGILYAVKGANNKMDGLNQSSKTRIHYIEVPASLLYKPILGKGRLILGFGPYLAFGIGGKAEIEQNGNIETFDIEFTDSVELGDTDAAYYKRWDAGANFSVGYEFAGNWSAQLNTQLGLLNIYPEYNSVSGDETTLKNIGFGISLGYKF